MTPKLKTSKKKRSLLEIVLMSLIFISWFYGYQRFWRAPRLLEVAELEKDESVSLAETESLKQRLAAIEGGRTPSSLLKNSPRGVAGLFEKVSRSNDRFSNIMVKLAEIKADSFTLGKISAAPPTKVDGFFKTAINLEAETTFLSLGSFLETLEDSPLLTEIESIEIKRQVSDLKLCNAKIKLYSYVSEVP